MQVTVCDVGPRDGLQNEQTVLEPPVRAELVNRLAAAGLPAVEAVSFVHPERVPQMAGAEEVVAGIDRRPGVVYSGLVLNAKGAERFARDRPRLAALQPRRDRELRPARTRTPRPRRRSRCSRPIETDKPVSVSISVAFGCPFEGAVDPARVLEIVERARSSSAPTRSSSPTRSASRSRAR